MEVWNEPNLEAFYTGKIDDYFDLYERTSRAVKGVDARLQVGGPVTAKNAWLDEFVGHCERNGLPLDFLSTHIYPTDAKGSAGDDTVGQLAGSHLGILKEKAQEAHAAAKGRPVYYTEWSSSSNPRDELHDEPFAAAYLVYAILNNVGLVDMYSWWTFSDIFEENYFPSQVFQGGFGLLTIYNTPKPVVRRLPPAARARRRAACRATATTRRPPAGSRGRPTQINVMLVNVALPRHEHCDANSQTDAQKLPRAQRRLRPAGGRRTRQPEAFVEGDGRTALSEGKSGGDARRRRPPAGPTIGEPRSTRGAGRWSCRWICRRRRWRW